MQSVHAIVFQVA